MSERLNLHKTLVLMALLNILQTIALVFLVIYEISVRPEATPITELYSLPVIVLLSLAGTVISVVILRPMLLLNLRLKQTEDSINDLNRLNNTLRAQRHDFMNHLQVVPSLIELDECGEANAYIEKVYGSIEKVNHILRTGIPAVNAILEAKRQMCENRGIKVTMEVRTTLADIPVPAWELCRVLGNIIDNAMNTLMEIEGERAITVNVYEDMQNYRFSISNNGPSIPPEMWTRIFEAGYTTRKLNGEGMGLTICREIITRYGGELKVFSNEKETEFEGSVPRKPPFAHGAG